MSQRPTQGRSNQDMLQSSATSPPPGSAPRVDQGRSWTLQEHAEVSSTNLVAAALGPWQAVRADTQTGGRGRFERSWVSDLGGLWLSAVTPLPVDGSARLLPLRAGLAVCETLAGLGVNEARLRWPNDVLVGEKKVAGLLIDQFTPGLAVVGIGINVTNCPEARDPSLRGQVARLADLVQPVPSLRELAREVLAALARACSEPAGERWLNRVNALWRLPRRVRLDLDHQILTGEFGGVDQAGRLILRPPEGAPSFFEPHEVRLLRELSP